jgi:uncharacterized membrane protein
MSTVNRSIDVDVPVSAAFCEWMQFERLPRFMHGVAEVKPLRERYLSWRAQVFGIERVWELEITEVEPGRRIAWASCAGPRNHGAILLEPLAPYGTRVTMEVHYDPTGFIEELSDYLGVLGRWVERSLVRFKGLMEQPSATLGGLPPVEELVGQ